MCCLSACRFERGGLLAAGEQVEVEVPPVSEAFDDADARAIEPARRGDAGDQETQPSQSPEPGRDLDPVVTPVSPQPVSLQPERDSGLRGADTEIDAGPLPEDTVSEDSTPDLCPENPEKTDPGACGCDVLDMDRDGDSIPDCQDPCPEDPGKVDPLVCGCGQQDRDSDRDGVMDCVDGCPSDPAKSDPGVCGCKTPDLDKNRDGRMDCMPRKKGKRPADRTQG